MGRIFSVPEETTPICAIRAALFKCNSDNKMVAIGLHGGNMVTNWVGVYGVVTPKKASFINPFSVFSFDDVQTPGYVQRLQNVKYVNEEDLEETPDPKDDKNANSKNTAKR